MEKNMENQDEILKNLHRAVMDGDSQRAAELAQESLQAGIPPLTTVNESLTPAIRQVGDLFGLGELFLPEMVCSADAMEAAIGVLEPHFAGGASRKKAKVLIGTVQGDIHDIGKNIVVALLKVNGYQVIDLGRDVPAHQFIDKAIDNDVQIIGLSGLLTTCLPVMRDVIQMMVEDGVRQRFKVLIGGGPTSLEFANKIGADGYGKNAYNAVELCDQYTNPG